MTMKKRANVVLTLAAILYAIVFWFHLFIHESWMEALYWIVQSALIGSVADWFAVEALFRKPLGFPYHTALLPRKKVALSDGIVVLVLERFVKLDQLQELLAKEKIVPRIDRYLRSEEGRLMLRSRLHQLAKVVLYSKTRKEWMGIAAGRVREWWKSQQVTPYVRDFLLSICDGKRGATQVTELITYLQAFLLSARGETWVGSLVESAVERKKSSSFAMKLASLFGVVNTEAMTKVVVEELQTELEEWKNPEGEERTTFLRALKAQVELLSEEEAAGITIEAVYQGWLQDAPIEEILESHVWPLLEKTIEAPSSPFIQKGEELVFRGWEAFIQQETSVAEVESLFQKLVYHLLPMLHQWLGKIVKIVLDDYSEKEFIQFVESKVEDDLAWIRLNGAAVGAVLGCFVWVVTLVYDLILIG